VHGTLGLRYTLGPYTTLRLLTHSIEDTEYANTVQLLRDNPAFYKTQAMQELGLHRIPEEKSDRELGAWIFSHVYDEMQQYFNPRNAVYYTFGWSGLLSARDRRVAGRSLYHQLKEVYRSWREQGYTPHISILGYSHGGTVAEHIAPYHAEDNEPTFTTIDELILLGTPSQRKTDCFATWPVFQQAYNIFSRGDFFQKIDVLSGPDAWPDRRFRYVENCSNHHQMYDIGFRVSMPPYCNGQYQYYRKGKHRRDYAPGHIELYFFEWSTSSWLYRKNFPLAPLPSAILVPAIIAQQHHFPSRDVMCDIWPPEQIIRIRERYTCGWNQYPFPIWTPLQELSSWTLQHAPELNTQLISSYSARKARSIVYTVWDDIYAKC